jgi:hypothetical protein
MSKIHTDLTEAIEAAFNAGLTEQAIEASRKAIRDLADSIEGDLEWRIKDNLAVQLVDHVICCAERSVEAMLAGNEGEMRRWLSCDKRGPDGEYYGWTGRSDGYTGGRKDGEFHSVIHGRLFEQGALELRKKVAQANEALLRDERIRDLEDQVKSLVIQLNKANAAKEEMWQRLRDARIDA